MPNAYLEIQKCHPDSRMGYPEVALSHLKLQNLNRELQTGYLKPSNIILTKKTYILYRQNRPEASVTKPCNKRFVLFLLSNPPAFSV
jgi:hypothetical protein